VLTAEHPATRLPALLFAVALSFAQPSQATEYSIDPSHTYASFEIDHLGFSTQRGQFNQSSGTVEFDPDAKTGRIDITIDTASLDTGFALRDEVLRSDTWFNAKDFPKILFRSRSLVFTDHTLSAVEGTLTMLGEARPMRLEINRFKCGFNLAKRKQGCGADAVGVLRRSEFGPTTACLSSVTKSACAFKSKPIYPEHPLLQLPGTSLKSCAGALFLRK